MTRRPVAPRSCAMSRRAPLWLEWVQDLFALACLLAATAGLTLWGVGAVGP